MKVALTGDRPTGGLHLGHYVGSLLNRVKLQNDYQQYIMIADTQGLTDNFHNPQKVFDNIPEVAKDYLAVGIDPEKTTIFIQSEIYELYELTMYYMNLVTLSRLMRNPTVKNEIHQKGYGQEIPMGFLSYPVSQASDITLFKADVVPVGNDQLPMIEQTNEIVRKFNRVYDTKCLREVKPILSKSSRLIGIDGKAKASKSLNNAIFLSDDTDEIKKKVFAMYTDPNHIKVSDPGKVEGNVVFEYLDAFHEDIEELNSLKASYKKGGLGDTTIKQILNNTLQNLIAPIREKRNSLSSKYIAEVLENGTTSAKDVAKNTMIEIRNCIKRYKI